MYGLGDMSKSRLATEAVYAPSKYYPDWGNYETVMMSEVCCVFTCWGVKM